MKIAAVLFLVFLAYAVGYPLYDYDDPSARRFANNQVRLHCYQCREESYCYDHWELCKAMCEPCGLQAYAASEKARMSEFLSVYILAPIGLPCIKFFGIWQPEMGHCLKLNLLLLADWDILLKYNHLSVCLSVQPISCLSIFYLQVINILLIALHVQLTAKYRVNEAAHFAKTATVHASSK